MTERVFIPGSQWLYFKLYTGSKSADELLINHIRSFTATLKEQGVIERFFFIRYSDPQFHLRLRLLLTDDSCFNSVFSQFYEMFRPCMYNEIISNIMCNTYTRELERYGRNSMEIAEQIFCIDSECIINLLYKIYETDNIDKESMRWKVSLLLIDNYLTIFEFNLTQKIEFIFTSAEGLKKEFGFTSSSYTKQLNDKYRNLRSQIDLVMEEDGSNNIYKDALDKHTKDLLPLAELLLNMENAGELEVSKQDLLRSIIHMTINRLFKSQNRIHEMVIYYFLEKCLKSIAAKLTNPIITKEVPENLRNCLS